MLASQVFFFSPWFRHELHADKTSRNFVFVWTGWVNKLNQIPGIRNFYKYVLFEALLSDKRKEIRPKNYMVIFFSAMGWLFLLFHGTITRTTKKEQPLNTSIGRFIGLNHHSQFIYKVSYSIWIP